MNLTHPSEIRTWLGRMNFKPSKVLGQNFLIDVNILKIMLATAHLVRDDVVLEVGPGLGVLTEWLLRWSGRVVAIEKDARLCAFLRERFAKSRNLELFEADALECDLEKLLSGGVNKVVANLPYSVGSRVLVELIESAHPPEQITVTVQLEVAHRLTASPPSKEYGLLSVLAQLRYEAGIRKEVSPSCFYPAPEVKSAIVNLVRRATPLDAGADKETLRELIKLAFSHRRKQLATTLKKFPPRRTSPRFGKLTSAQIESLFQKTGIDSQARPEAIPPEKWPELSSALAGIFS